MSASGLLAYWMMRNANKRREREDLERLEREAKEKKPKPEPEKKPGKTWRGVPL